MNIVNFYEVFEATFAYSFTKCGTNKTKHLFVNIACLMNTEFIHYREKAIIYLTY